MDLTRIIAFLNEFQESGQLALIANDPRISFGSERRPLLFARYLPNRLSTNNVIIEQIVRFGQMVANDGNPLSPPQKKSPPAASLPMTVALGHIDIATQMPADGKEWRDLGNLLNGNDAAPAQSFVASWFIRNVRLAIEAKAEIQRAQAIANAQVIVSPMDTDPFTVQLPDPSGHRITIPSGTVAAPTGWYNPDYDPFIEDIQPIKQFLADKGFTVSDIIMSSRVQGALMTNNTVARRMPGGVSLTVDADGQLQSALGATSMTGLNSVFQSFGLPTPTVYDQKYSTQTGSYRYLDDGKVIFICSTGMDETIIFPTEEGLQSEIVEDTLGYYGIGVSIGQTTPGIVVSTETRTKKPPGYYVEAYQDCFPVITQPEAIAVLTIPEPTP